MAFENEEDVEVLKDEINRLQEENFELQNRVDRLTREVMSAPPSCRHEMGG
jgi:uncharacterized protein YlxW (UPF0749 family)